MIKAIVQMNGSNRIGGFGGGFTPAVKWLIGINVLIFIVQRFSGQAGSRLYVELIEWFALNYTQIIQGGKIWQVGTYMFLHGGFWHILFNMLFLFFFGPELERMWGTKRFVRYYLITGVGAGLFIFFVDFCSVVFWGNQVHTTLGASGAILGILVAYALCFPERQITLLLFFVLPVTLKAKHFALGYAAIEIFSFVLGRQQGISHAGHIGGMLSGLIFFMLHRRDVMYAAPNRSIEAMLSSIRGFFGAQNRSNNMDSYSYGGDSRSYGSLSVSRKHLSLDETHMTDKEIEKTIDVLLEVISRKGIKELRLEEQMFLDRVSNLYRHKFPE